MNLSEFFTGRVGRLAYLGKSLAACALVVALMMAPIYVPVVKSSVSLYFGCGLIGIYLLSLTIRRVNDIGKGKKVFFTLGLANLVCVGLTLAVSKVPLLASYTLYIMGASAVSNLAWTCYGLYLLFAPGKKAEVRTYNSPVRTKRAA